MVKNCKKKYYRFPSVGIDPDLAQTGAAGGGKKARRHQIEVESLGNCAKKTVTEQNGTNRWDQFYSELNCMALL